MVDHSYGLRFDIYERVHLSEDVIGIEELEEIELFPKIQVYPGDEYAALRGHLLLSGLYRGEGESRELEHWIPVEITIPLSRVNKLEEITVEIENFDVDLLSARSLNITGVLSLQGIETATMRSEAEEWMDREYVAAHEPVIGTGEVGEAQSQQDNYSYQVPEVSVDHSYVAQEAFPSAQQYGAREQHEEQNEETLSWLDSAPLLTPTFTADKGLNEGEPSLEAAQWEDSEAEEPNAAVWSEDQEQVNAHSERADEAEAVLKTDSYAEAEVEDVTAEVEEAEAVEVFEESVQQEKEEGAHAQEEKKELKVAFGSKDRDEGFGISKLLHNRPEKDGGVEYFEEEIVIPDQEEGEEVRWKSLFLGNTEDQTPFRKVRLVIVQREETLDDIAERYQLSTRELQLYNRLSEHDLAEGQVLYIP
ncbi:MULTISPECIES: LysM peptidoglycan-binding domain-containing protein [unclassified Paenibacillus]|uniref:LysM peptidoglycan-binding domain-containing protein n=1 Tax=unclassified Paenibacillus TaxID=185978 RepID=UPI00083932E8|nr:MULTISPECIES: LysM peptidoglycan-binding domain-containing protein [unclassified Paenibacillus]NWL88910.1 LysM peptidoglycan-binding domain-containing protein [Paenibacillus sp. 79R4]